MNDPEPTAVIEAAVFPPLLPLWMFTITTSVAATVEFETAISAHASGEMLSADVVICPQILLIVAA